VIRRDEGRCTFVNDRGERCPSDYRLAVHHVVPIRDGGAQLDPSNLVTLCRYHHSKTEEQRRRLERWKKKKETRTENYVGN